MPHPVDAHRPEIRPQRTAQYLHQAALAAPVAAEHRRNAARFNGEVHSRKDTPVAERHAATHAQQFAAPHAEVAVVEKLVTVTLDDPDIEIKRIDRRLAQQAPRDDCRAVARDHPCQPDAHGHAKKEHGRIIKAEYEQQFPDHRPNIRKKRVEYRPPAFYSA